MSAPQTAGNLNGLRFTDRILCSAVETEAGYLARVGRDFYRLDMDSGLMILLTARQAWLMLQSGYEPAPADEWSDEDERAAERAGAADPLL